MVAIKSAREGPSTGKLSGAGEVPVGYRGDGQSLTSWGFTRLIPKVASKKGQMKIASSTNLC